MLYCLKKFNVVSKLLIESADSQLSSQIVVVDPVDLSGEI